MTRRSLSIIALVGIQVFVLATAAHASVTVPEPTTLTLLGTAAAAGAVGAWWRNRRKK